MSERPLAPTKATHPKLWMAALMLKSERHCGCDGPDNLHVTEWWPCACLGDAERECLGEVE